MIDRELVTRKMLLIARDLAPLQELAARPLDAYLASPTDEVLAERYLERVIGRMIDINYHLITESGQAPPSDYFASFIQLADLRVLEHEFARRMAACAGLRNRIAHEYNELDPRKVHEAVRAAVDDFPVYLRAVERFVQP